MLNSALQVPQRHSKCFLLKNRVNNISRIIEKDEGPVGLHRLCEALTRAQVFSWRWVALIGASNRKGLVLSTICFKNVETNVGQ